MASRPLPARGRPKGPTRSEAKDNLDHYRRFAETLTLVDDKTGQNRPFVLEDFQLAMLADYFAGYSETLVEVPSGSGKTTLFATVALHHGTFVRRDCRVLILSASGKQGRQMYEAAAGMVERSKSLRKWWAPQEYGLGRVKSLTDRGVIEIVSPSPKVTEGEIPTLVLSDEIHRMVDDGRAHSILLSKLQKRDARVLGCTTAGDDEESFLGRKRRDALESEGMFVEGHLVPDLRSKGDAVKSTLGREVVRPGEYYTVCRDVDKVTAFHEWSLPEHCSPEDFVEVKRCNPASFVTPESLRRTHKLLKTRAWDWLRQHCNRWALGESSAIDPAKWRAIGGLEVVPLSGRPFWVGFDMGGVSDTTAIIPVWRDDPEPLTGDALAEAVRVAITADLDDETISRLGERQPRFVTSGGLIVHPPGEGEWTLVDDVLAALDQVTNLPGKFQGLVFDKAKGGGYIAQELERKRRWTIIDHGQSVEMDDASELLARLVVEARLSHSDDPAITRQVLAAAAKRSRRTHWYLSKPESQPHRKIDAAVALAMALRVANAGPARNPYEGKDLLVLG